MYNFIFIELMVIILREEIRHKKKYNNLRNAIYNALENMDLQ